MRRKTISLIIAITIILSSITSIAAPYDITSKVNPENSYTYSQVRRSPSILRNILNNQKDYTIESNNETFYELEDVQDLVSQGNTLEDVVSELEALENSLITKLNDIDLMQLNSKHYTSSTWENFQNVILNANQVLVENKTKEKLSSALADLNNALYSLVPIVEIKIVNIDKLFKTIIQGDEYDLPTKVKAIMSDGTQELVNITWQVEEYNLNIPSVYIYTGYVNTYENPVELELTVKEKMSEVELQEISGSENYIRYINNIYKEIGSYEDVTIAILLSNIEYSDTIDGLSIVDENRDEISDTLGLLEAGMQLKVESNGRTLYYKIFLNPVIYIDNDIRIRNEVVINYGTTVTNLISRITTSQEVYEINVVESRTHEIVSGDQVIDNTMLLKVTNAQGSYHFSIKILHEDLNLEIGNNNIIRQINNNNSFIIVNEGITAQQIVENIITQYGISIVENDELTLVGDNIAVNSTMLLKININGSDLFYIIYVQPKIILLDETIIKDTDGFNFLSIYPGKTIGEVRAAIKTTNTSDIIVFKDNYDNEIYDVNTLVNNNMWLNIRTTNGGYGYVINVINDEVTLIDNDNICNYLNDNSMELGLKEGITINQLLTSISSNSEEDIISVVDNSYNEIVDDQLQLTSNMFLLVNRDGLKFYYSIAVRPILINKDTTNTIIKKIDENNVFVSIDKTVLEVLESLETLDSNDDIFISYRGNGQIPLDSETINSDMRIYVSRNGQTSGYGIVVIHSTNLNQLPNTEDFIRYVDNERSQVSSYEDVKVGELLASIKSSNTEDNLKVVDENKVEITDEDFILKAGMLVKVDSNGSILYYRIFLNPVIYMDGIRIKNEVVINFGLTVSELISKITASQEDYETYVVEAKTNEIINGDQAVDNTMALKISRNQSDYYFGIKILHENLDLQIKDNNLIRYINNNILFVMVNEGITAKNIKDGVSSNYNYTIVESDKSTLVRDDFPVNSNMLIKIKVGENYLYYSISVQPKIIIKNETIIEDTDGFFYINVYPGKTLKEVRRAIGTTNTSDKIVFRDNYDNEIYDENTLANNSMRLNLRRGNTGYGYAINVINDEVILIDNDNICNHLDNRYMQIEFNEGLTASQLKSTIRSNVTGDLINIVDNNYNEISNPETALTSNMYLEVDRAGLKFYYSINVRLKVMSIDITNTIIMDIDEYDVFIYPGQKISDVIGSLKTTNNSDQITIRYRFKEEIPLDNEPVDSDMRIYVKRNGQMSGYGIVIVHNAHLYPLDNSEDIIRYVDNDRSQIGSYEDVTIKEFKDIIKSSNNEDILTVVDENKVEITDANILLEAGMLLKVQSIDHALYYRIFLNPVIYIDGIKIRSEVKIEFGTTVSDLISRITTSQEGYDKLIVGSRTDEIVSGDNVIDNTMELKITKNQSNYYFSIRIQHEDLDLQINNEDLIRYINNDNLFVMVNEGTTAKNIKDGVSSNYDYAIVESDKSTSVGNDASVNNNMLIKITVGEYYLYYRISVQPKIIIKNDTTIKYTDGFYYLSVYPGKTLKQVREAIETTNISDKIEFRDNYYNEIYDENKLVNNSMRLHIRRENSGYGYTIYVVNDEVRLTDNNQICNYLDNMNMEIGLNEGITIDQLLSSIGLNGTADSVIIVDDRYNQINELESVLTNNMYLEVDRAGSKLYYSINVKPKLINKDLTNTTIKNIDDYNVYIYAGKKAHEVISSIGTTTNSDEIIIRYRNTWENVNEDEMVDSTMIIHIIRNGKTSGYSIKVVHNTVLNNISENEDVIRYINNEYSEIGSYDDVTIYSFLEFIKSSNINDILTVVDENKSIIDNPLFFLKQGMLLKVQSKDYTLYYSIFLDPVIFMENSTFRNEITVEFGIKVSELINRISKSQANDTILVVDGNTGEIIDGNQTVDNLMYIRIIRRQNNYFFRIFINQDLLDLEIKDKDVIKYLDNKDYYLEVNEGITAQNIKESIIHSNSLSIVEGDRMTVVEDSIPVNKSMLLKVSIDGNYLYYEIGVKPEIKVINPSIIKDTDGFNYITAEPGKTIGQVKGAIKTSDTSDLIVFMDYYNNEIYDDDLLVDDSMWLNIRTGSFGFGYSIYVINDKVLLNILNSEVINYINNSYMEIFLNEETTIDELLISIGKSDNDKIKIVDKNYIEITDGSTMVKDNMYICITRDMNDHYYSLIIRPTITINNPTYIKSVNKYSITAYAETTFNELVLSINIADENYIITFVGRDGSVIDNWENDVNTGMAMILVSEDREYWFDFNATIEGLVLSDEQGVCYIDNEYMSIGANDSITRSVTITELLLSISSNLDGSQIKIVDENYNIIEEDNHNQKLRSTMLLEINYNDIRVYYNIYVYLILENINDEVIKSIKNQIVHVFPGKTSKEVLDAIKTSEYTDNKIIIIEDTGRIVSDNEIANENMTVYISRDGITTSKYYIRIGGIDNDGKSMGLNETKHINIIRFEKEDLLKSKFLTGK